MASTAMNTQSISDLMLNIEQEIFVKASLEHTFDALLEQLGPRNTGAEGKPMALKIEPWPGGRWFRDLGNNNGHHWAHVQAIKRPTLVEFYGPLMMSFPVTSNVQYRLSEVDGGTLIKFHHTGMGLIPEQVRTGLNSGWKGIHERVKAHAESKK
jgi:hypothetical protein